VVERQPVPGGSRRRAGREDRDIGLGLPVKELADGAVAEEAAERHAMDLDARCAADTGASLSDGRHGARIPLTLTRIRNSRSSLC
jgi:hypothetical protein